MLQLMQPSMLLANRVLIFSNLQGAATASDRGWLEIVIAADFFL